MIKYSDNYSKTSGCLWQYYNDRDEPSDTLIDFDSCISQVKVTENNPNNGNAKVVKIAVPLKYLSNFWKTLEIPLIH